MSHLFRSHTSLLNSQQLDSSGATSLVLERLYYADGRQNPSHPATAALRPVLAGLRQSVSSNTNKSDLAAEHCSY